MKTAIAVTGNPSVEIETIDNPKKKKGHKAAKHKATKSKAAHKAAPKHKAAKKQHKAAPSMSVAAHVSSAVKKAVGKMKRSNLVPIGHKTRPVFIRTGHNTIKRSHEAMSEPYKITNPFKFQKGASGMFPNAVPAAIAATVSYITLDVIFEYVPTALKKENVVRLGLKAAGGFGLAYLVGMKSKTASTFVLIGALINVVNDAVQTYEAYKILPKFTAPTMIPATTETTTKQVITAREMSAISDMRKVGSDYDGSLAAQIAVITGEKSIM